VNQQCIHPDFIGALIYDPIGKIMILDKCDQVSVNKIISLGYPSNIEYLDELLRWTCDPNWPIAASIYDFFIKLGESEVPRVLKVASEADYDWRYSIITQIISYYDKASLQLCAETLKSWSKRTGSDECDFESLRILSDNELIEDEIISEIATRNLFVYNLWIKETLDAAGKSIYKFPLKDHTL
jgi:hypothetical protein